MRIASILAAFASVGILHVHGATAPATTPEFTSKAGQLYADDKPFYLKGVNWFGGETIERVPQGLWPYGTTIEEALSLLESYGVNALRLPIAIDSVVNNDIVDKDQVAGSPDLVGKTYLEVLDVLINSARNHGMLVVVDNHRMRADEPDFPDTAVPSAITPAMDILAARYCNNPSTWNLIGIDIKNEPKGKATWAMGDPSTDWNTQAAEIGNAVLAKCKRWLIFVEGVQTHIKGVSLKWGQAGGSLQGAKANPVELKNMAKLVYSPHLLSPGIDYKSPWWGETNFPDNMPPLWDAYFGSVRNATNTSVVVGSWGAKMEGKDGKWANAVATYLAARGIGSFYWAFNPQSADTGGLVMDDWKTPIDERFELLSGLPATNMSTLLSKYSKCQAGTCAGNGKCVDGRCECYTGWTGAQCEICTPDDEIACNHGGKCGVDSTCHCDPGVQGKYCDGGSCDNISCGGDNAGCTSGQCFCTYRCQGSECTACAANSSAAVDGKPLCSTCPKPVAAGTTRVWMSHVSVVVVALLAFAHTL